MRCPEHPDRLVAGRCGVCGEHFCADCLGEASLGEPACPRCAPALARRLSAQPPAGRSRILPLMLLAALLVSVGLTALLLWPDERPPPPPDDSERAWRAAWQALEETGQALELFKLREGRYPDRLDELVPTDLAALPPDPYAPQGRPLAWGRTRALPASRLLYSLGPDRLDGRGAPYDPLERRGDLVYPLR